MQTPNNNRRFNASVNVNRKHENNFKGRPVLGHELNSVIIVAGAIIGKNGYKSHQVTTGISRGGAPAIVDHVYTGPGGKFRGIYISKIMCILVKIVLFLTIYQIMQQ